MSLLISTFGTSWQIVPELLAALQPGLALFAQHPQPATLDSFRERCGLAPLQSGHERANPQQPLKELWLAVSDGDKSSRQLNLLDDWLTLNLPTLTVRCFIATGTKDVNSIAEIEHLRELIFRLILHGSEQAPGHLLLSLAGGRKTMSADMQTAASYFGCRALLHILAPDSLSDDWKNGSVERWSKSMPPELAAQIHPVLVDRLPRSELLDLPVATGDNAEIHARNFPLPPALNHATRTRHSFPMPTEPALCRNLEARRAQSHALFSNYLQTIAQQEKRENWRSLYRCPPRIIGYLKQTRVSAQPALLNQIPKADLHCHLGGILDLSAQNRVGTSLWAQASSAERTRALDAIAPLLNTPNWPSDWRSKFGLVGSTNPLARSVRAAALLSQLDAATLERNLYGPTLPRLALKEQHPQGFQAYAAPGDLSGSALLSDPRSIESYAREVVRYAEEQRLALLEIRGSPAKYRPSDPCGWLQDFHTALQHAQKELQTTAHLAFICILNRAETTPTSPLKTVKSALEARQALPDFVVGLDVAGDEKAAPPEAFKDAFDPAFEHCLPITIHAGEGQPVASIWSAVYRLHADRVGHGLTLLEHPELLRRFIDRGICVELCPTSNLEVVGYRCAGIPDSEKLPDYPLEAYLRAGLAVTLCTDNPGISRTNPLQELLMADRLCPNGLSLWDALSLLKQGFVSSFLPFADKERLLKMADAQVYRLIMQHLDSHVFGMNIPSPTKALHERNPDV